MCVPYLLASSDSSSGGNDTHSYCFWFSFLCFSRFAFLIGVDFQFFELFFLGLFGGRFSAVSIFGFWCGFMGGRRASVCIVRMKRVQLFAITGRVSRKEGAAAI